MTNEERREDYARITRIFLDAGFKAINGFGKGGFWVRRQDDSKPVFVDGNSFISYRKAKSVVLAMESVYPQDWRTVFQFNPPGWQEIEV